MLSEAEKIRMRGSLTDKQAAAYLGIGVEKIHSLRMSGVLGYTTILGGIRYPKFELDDLMRRNLIYEEKPSVEKYRKKY